MLGERPGGSQSGGMAECDALQGVAADDSLESTRRDAPAIQSLRATLHITIAKLISIGRQVITKRAG